MREQLLSDYDARMDLARRLGTAIGILKNLLSALEGREQELGWYVQTECRHAKAFVEREGEK